MFSNRVIHRLGEHREQKPSSYCEPCIKVCSCENRERKNKSRNASERLSYKIRTTVKKHTAQGRILEVQTSNKLHKQKVVLEIDGEKI